MYDRILIPLDGSSHAEAAIPFAEFIPSRLVVLVEVEPHLPTTGNGAGSTDRQVRANSLFRPGSPYLERAAAPFRRQGREVEVLRCAGNPADRIIEAAVDADLIVMATHGRGPLGRVLRGSVADRIAREASVATLLVRGEGHAVAPPVMRLVVPLDGSQFAASALPVAATLAGDLGLPIHLVRVVERPMVWNPFTAGARFEEADQRRMKPGAEEAAEEFVFHTTRLGDPVIVATHEVRSGEPIPELLAVLRPGDLIVMSSHGCGGVRRLFLGSVASALVREADAPVLLVRADSAAEPDPFGTSESVQGETSAS